MIIVDDKIISGVPFPELITPPPRLALKLRERIRYMFGIIVEPVIIRCNASYYKTTAFAHVWEMMTKCRRYRIASYERAEHMAKLSSWRVLDNPLFEPPANHRTVTKFIY